MRPVQDAEIKRMIALAKDAQMRAYVPYSHFRVGACLKAGSGAYYLGCNIENAAYSPTNCAERTAMFKAVYEGERSFDALAVISDGESFTMPCGVCRQVLAEFCDKNMPVACANKHGVYKVFTLEELLPNSFTAKDMGR